MSETPWFKFYPSDWLSGTRGLTAVESGVYIGLIAMMYDHGCSLEWDDKRLSRHCGADVRQFQRALKILIDDGKIIVVDGRLWNDRAATEMQERAAKVCMAQQAGRVSQKVKKQQKQNENSTDVHQEVNGRSTIPESESERVLCSVARARDPDHDLETVLREAAGWENEPHPNLMIIGAIAATISAGADLEMDVIPVVRGLAPKIRPLGWKYFIGPIQQAQADRIKASTGPPASDIVQFHPQFNSRFPDAQNHKPSRQDNLADIGERIAQAIAAQGAESS